MNFTLQYFGREWSPDFNCWDFVRLVYRESYNIELPAYGVDSPLDFAATKAAEASERGRGCWNETYRPKPGAVVLMAKGSTYHAGVLLGGRSVLHLQACAGLRNQRLSELQRNFQNITFYHHAELHHA